MAKDTRRPLQEPRALTPRSTEPDHHLSPPAVSTNSPAVSHWLLRAKAPLAVTARPCKQQAHLPPTAITRQSPARPGLLSPRALLSQSLVHRPQELFQTRAWLSSSAAAANRLAIAACYPALGTGPPRAEPHSSTPKGLPRLSGHCPVSAS
ncbi:hypothetical protein GJAV_G00239060 [Gymnothorax javanicus]|nr:hypothetical protein GJAV_G00239060 [Gymnothorax javanicus]